MKRGEKLDNKTLLIIIGAVLAFVLLIPVINLMSGKKGGSLLRMPGIFTQTITPGPPKDSLAEVPSAYTNNVVLRIPILMYHHVGPLPGKPDALRKDLTVSSEDFEMQLAWLKAQGYESITLSDLQLFFQKKFSMPSKPVIFTFDDGYDDVFAYAQPLLKKYGFKGSYAIITQFPGITMGTNTYASWHQIKGAVKDGAEIVSHTQDHFDGTDKKYSDSFILQNYTDSIKDIKNNLGNNTTVLIYPYGHYNAHLIDLAKKAGFEMGVTTNFGKSVGLNNLMEVPRVRVHGHETMETFQKLINE